MDDRPRPMDEAPLAALRLHHDRRLVMVAMALQLVPTLFFLRTDLALGQGLPDLLAPRLVVRSLLVGVSAAGLLIMRRIRARTAYRTAVFGLALSLVATVLGLNVLRPAGASLPLRTPFYVVAVLYFAMPNTLWRQLLPPLLQSAALIGLRLTWLTGGEGDPAGDVLILLVLNAFGILSVLHRLRLERQFAEAWTGERAARLESDRALGELRTLRGIIPICSHCKRVRTEAGNWQQIERYVHEHSDAEFSHGLCPVCLREHYPESAPPPGGAG